MTADPRIRKDGCCAQCRKPRNVKLGVARVAGTNLDALVAASADPFCSATCCRVWFGCDLETTRRRESQQARRDREAA